MVKLERADIHAAFVLTYLKYTPITEQDVQNMKQIHVVDDKESKNLEKSKGKLVSIKKNAIQETPEVPIVEKSKRKVVRIKKSEIQEGPEVQFSRKVKSSSSGLMGFSRKSHGSSCFDGEKLVTSKNQETLGGECGQKVRKISRKSYGSSCFDGSKNQETPEVECASKVRKFSRKSYRSSCFDGEKLVTSKNQETPEVECAQKVRKFSRKSYGSSSFDGEKCKKVRISPSRLMNASGVAPKLPPIESLRAKIGQCSNPFMKYLKKSDVDGHQGRLLLTNEDVKNHLLPMLNQEEVEDIAEGIEVKTYDPMGNFSNMVFKTWGDGKSYVILAGWKQFFQQHELKESDCVTGWMFRDNQTNELCFALTWTKDDADDEEAAPNSNSDSSVWLHESQDIQK